VVEVTQTRTGEEQKMAHTLGWTLRTATLAACVAVSMAGCSGTMSVGRDFDYNRFAARAQVGTTDAAQVREWLGAPAGTGAEVFGDTRYEVWTYYYGTGVVPGGADTRFKLLQVKFHPQGKVAGWTWSGDTPGAAAVEDKSTTKPKY
jgi:outer membrane protein assembly factor BamE (lipoprotein component of BamABCDE complex)